MIRALYRRLRASWRKISECPFDTPGCALSKPCAECREDRWW